MANNHRSLLFLLSLALASPLTTTTLAFQQRPPQQRQLPNVRSPLSSAKNQHLSTKTKTRKRPHCELVLQQSSVSLDPGSSSIEDDTQTPPSPPSSSSSSNYSNGSSNTTGTSTIHSVSDWHRQRRREMLQKYGDQIAPLERTASSQWIGLPLLAVVVCGGLWTGAVVSGGLPVAAVVLLGIFPGSILSLWQLQLLHDVLHGCFYTKGQTHFGIPLLNKTVSRQTLQDWTLFAGSLPCIFGYHLYLNAGHLSHHQQTGEYDLAQLFDSSEYALEDGDVLFVAHRMRLKGDYGPKVKLLGKEIKMSISRSGFYFWKEGEVVLNALRFIASFLYERALLSFNDVIVALTGRNFFFPNKPDAFHRDCARYARVATALRLALCAISGWKALLFLFVAETAWSLPPHPACAMFVSNHGSRLDDRNGKCRPTASTYAGRWYSVLTLGTNYHLEHHDFPTIPLDKLGKLRQIAPEYYSESSNDNLWDVMRQAFGKPDFYACSSPHNHHQPFAEPAMRATAVSIGGTTGGPSEATVS